MKNENIDNLFKRGLADPVDETGYREDDWGDLEQMLDKGKKRRGIVFWLPVISSVAAMALLFLGWWFFKPQDSATPKKPQQIAVAGHKKQVEQPVKTTDPSTQGRANTQKDNRVAIASVATIAVDNKTSGIIKAGDLANVNNKVNKKTIGTPHNFVTALSPPVIIPTPVTPAVTNNTLELTAANSGVELNSKPGVYIADVAAKDLTTGNEYAKFLAVKRNKIVTKSSFMHPQFALTVLGAPEINGVNSFQDGKRGSNLGLMVSVGISKFTFSTGASYSTKPYNTSFDNYHSTNYTFRTNPVNVIADCRVIDIPLNLDYQVYNKHNNKFSVGTGVSSYLMMHESYNYDYADPATRGPRSYTIAKPGNYLFGVLNLQATYQRQVNSKIGVSVQPYLKLPLANIGTSNVRLQSAGVALGLSWNINSLTKP